MQKWGLCRSPEGWCTAWSWRTCHMPKHRGGSDRMAPARILLDDPAKWREPGFTQSCPLLFRHRLPPELCPSTTLEIAGWHRPSLFQASELLPYNRAGWKISCPMPKLATYPLWFSSTGIAKEPRLVTPKTCWQTAGEKKKREDGRRIWDSHEYLKFWRAEFFEMLRVKSLSVPKLHSQLCTQLLCKTANYFGLSSLVSSRLVTHHC